MNVVSGEVTFNARGFAATAAQPRFVGGTAYGSSLTYDVRDRVVETLLPDTNTESFDYGLTWSARTNPEGVPVTAPLKRQRPVFEEPFRGGAIRSWKAGSAFPRKRRVGWRATRAWA